MYKATKLARFTEQAQLFSQINCSRFHYFHDLDPTISEMVMSALTTEERGRLQKLLDVCAVNITNNVDYDEDAASANRDPHYKTFFPAACDDPRYSGRTLCMANEVGGMLPGRHVMNIQ